MDSMGECLPWLRTIFLNWSLFLRSNLCDTVMAWLYPPPSDRWGSAGPSVRPPGEHSVTHPLAPACRPLPLICSFCLLTPDSVRAESLNFFTGLCRTSGSLCTFGRPGRAGRCLRPLCQANFSFRAGPWWCADRGYWQPPRDQEVHRALSPLFCLHGFTEAPGHQLKEWRSGHSCLSACVLSPFSSSSSTHAAYPMSRADFFPPLPFLLTWFTRWLLIGEEIFSPQRLPFKTKAFLQIQKSYSRCQKLDLSLCIPAVCP